MVVEAHEAILLAAGGSTRLGRPKQLLTRHGESLLRRAARLLAQTAPRRLLVVLGAQADELRGQLDGLPASIAVNARWREGLASSLQAASAELGAAARVLIAVCDQPALELRHLETLLRAGPCAATRRGGRLGVPAVIDAATWSRARELAGDHGFAALLDARTCAAIEAPELDYDIDTPAQLEHARARGWID